MSSPIDFANVVMEGGSDDTSTSDEWSSDGEATTIPEEEMPPPDPARQGAQIFGLVRAITLAKTEENCPTTMLQESLDYNKVPLARPQQIEHSTRCLSRGMWAAYALFKRDEAMNGECCFAPPLRMLWRTHVAFLHGLRDFTFVQVLSG